MTKKHEIKRVKCAKCFECNLLLNVNFKGKYECENFIDAFSDRNTTNGEQIKMNK